MNVIQLTKEQVNAFEKLWFIYGNGGIKSTLLNHKLVQGFYQYREDRRKLYENAGDNMRERGFSEDKIDRDDLTNECVKVCSLVLDGKISEAMNISKSL
jgi:hypothetical protein